MTQQQGGPQQLQKAQLDKLRKLALPVGQDTGLVSDVERSQMLVKGRAPFAIEDTVIAIPFSLLIAGASMVGLNVVGPMLAQVEGVSSRKSKAE